MSDPGYPISELVARTGVPAVTIHHYRAVGLLPEPARVARNRFLYDDRHAEAVKLVRMLRQRRGLPLRLIGDIIPDLLECGGDPSGQQAWEVALAGYELPEAPARQRLLDAAITMFSSPGYAEVTMSEIADSAGIAKGSVYRYFGSKDELFFAAVRTCLDEAMIRFRERALDAGAPVDVDTAARLLGGVVLPAMPLLMDLAAQTLQGHAGRLEVAQHVLDVLLDSVGSLTRGRGAAHDRAGRVLQRVMVRAFQATLPPDHATV